MGKIRILDCTLRDGGYINNWCFGNDNMADITKKMVVAGIDIVELGFIRNEEYDCNRAVFNAMTNVEQFVKKCQKVKSNHAQFAVMAEISNPIPLDMIEPYDKNNIDIVRVIVWKSRRDANGKFVDALHDSYEYCKGFIEKGYKVCVQPNRTNQYSDDEFRHMLTMFAELSPMAIYIVDSWGTMYADDVAHYAEIAEKVLPQDIAMGLHGHNNMQQAFANAEKFIEKQFNHDVIIDASVCGIGRGAGNLHLEYIARYLNTKHNKHYNLLPLLEVYDRHIKLLSEKYSWGSSVPFFLSANADVNPNYASYLGDKISSVRLHQLIADLPREKQVIFSRDFTESILQKQAR